MKIENYQEQIDINRLTWRRFVFVITLWKCLTQSEKEFDYIDVVYLRFDSRTNVENVSVE